MRALLLFVVATFVACARSPRTAPSTEPGVQKIEIHTPKGDFRVWTKRVGSNPRIKLLLLHGGPAATHEYFEALEPLSDEIELIYYDQLGSAFSDQPDEPSLWNIDRFVDEVEQVRVALGLDESNFYLLGHSWGGILAVEYALAHPEHLKGLVISNMMMSIPEYNRYAAEVLAPQMPPEVVAEVKALEAAGKYDDPRYMELLVPHFYKQHVCRLPEWPPAVERSLAAINKKIYVMMQGPSEFGLTGTLEHWDRTADLGRLTMPTLVIGATHDTMDPAHMRWVSEQVPHGTFLLCPDGSHLAMWDDQAVYVSGLRQWLRSVDSGASVSSVRLPELAFFHGRWHADATNPMTGDRFSLDYAVEPFLGGAWLRGTGRADALGLDIHDLWGKDAATGELVRIVVDSTGIHGTVRSPGWNGDTLVLEGDVSTADGVVRVRETITRLSADTFDATWEMQQAGAWVAYSVEHLRRVGS